MNKSKRDNPRVRIPSRATRKRLSRARKRRWWRLSELELLFREHDRLTIRTICFLLGRSYYVVRKMINAYNLTTKYDQRYEKQVQQVQQSPTFDDYELAPGGPNPFKELFREVK